MGKESNKDFWTLLVIAVLVFFSACNDKQDEFNPDQPTQMGSFTAVDWGCPIEGIDINPDAVCPQQRISVDGAVLIWYLDKFLPYADPNFHHVLWIGPTGDANSLGLLKIVGAGVPSYPGEDYGRWETTIAICTVCEAQAWANTVNDYLHSCGYLEQSETINLRAFGYTYN